VTLPYFNYNTNTLLAPTTTTTTVTPPSSTERGVYGGHFDVDIYYNICNPLSSSGYRRTCASNTHVHEYDDIYDVVGVNLLNASDPKFNLSNAITSTGTGFKILVANTNWSPAAKLKIGAVERYVWEWPVTASGFIADSVGNAMTFDRQTIGSLQFKFPVDAFTNREWKAGSGDVRAGLIPTQTGCVRDNKGAQGALNGPWMNGALAIQIVMGTTPGSAVEATLPASAGGFRLKKDTTSQAYQLAQYTTFWHHPNGLCTGDAGWTKTPPPDPVSDATPKTPAAGSGDPTGSFLSGSFGSTGTISGGTTTVVTYNGIEVTMTRTFTGTSVDQTLRDASGTVISHTVSSYGEVVEGRRLDQNLLRTGRLGWREQVR
jgi:hypothetical protein